MTTRKERVEKLVSDLADVGIYAMYGGSSSDSRSGKGHGFWLYRAKDEAADAEIKAGRGFGLMCEGARLENIKNNGTKSGNGCFTMFDDALEILA